MVVSARRIPRLSVGLPRPKSAHANGADTDYHQQEHAPFHRAHLVGEIKKRALDVVDVVPHVDQVSLQCSPGLHRALKK